MSPDRQPSAEPIEAGDPREPEDETARRPALLVAAAVVSILVVGLVLIFGVERPPSLTSLVDEPAPAPPAQVALLSWADGRDCVTIAEVDGTTRQPWCDDTGGDLVGWDDRGLVLHTYEGPSDVEVIVDPVDGDVITTRTVPTDGLFEDDAVVTSHRPSSGQLEVRLVDGSVLWSTPAPPSYDIREAHRSPDGDAVAMVDAAGRLLLVPTDGSAPPRVWADDVDQWSTLVWRDDG